MKSLIIKSTPETPNIKFDQKKGSLEIKGISIPGDPLKFYSPVLAWLNEYSLNPQKQTQMDIHFKYVNTSSSKWLFDLFKKCQKARGCTFKRIYFLKYMSL